MSEIERLAQVAADADPDDGGLVEYYEPIVRAVLQALREPGEGALDAGGRQIDFHDLIEEDEYASRFAAGLKAMIDHLLSE